MRAHDHRRVLASRRPRPLAIDLDIVVYSGSNFVCLDLKLILTQLLLFVLENDMFCRGCASARGLISYRAWLTEHNGLLCVAAALITRKRRECCLCQEASFFPSFLPSFFPSVRHAMCLFFFEKPTRQLRRDLLFSFVVEC